MDRKYVAIKMATGEDILSLVQAEDAIGVMLLHPMQIHHQTDPEESLEHYWAQPFCAFSEEQSFFIEKRHLVYMKKMSDYLVPYYHSMVQKFSESEIIKNARLQAENKVVWGGKEISEEEARRRVEMLKSLRQAKDEDTIIH